MDIFDKRISEKLESIEAETHEKDWERFNKKFSQNKQPFSKFAFRNIYKIAATIAVTSMLFIASAQYFIIENLNQDLTESESEKEKLYAQNQNYLTKITELEEEIAPHNSETTAIIANKNSSSIVNNGNKIANVKGIKPSKKVTKKKTKFLVRVKTAIANIFNTKKDSTKPINKSKPDSIKKAQDQ